MGHMVLFIYLKIILLRIQTDPKIINESLYLIHFNFNSSD